MITDGLLGFIGVIIGGLLTFLSQYIFEIHRGKIKNRKIFLREHYKISNNLFKIKQALIQFESFTNMNLNNYTDDDLAGELYHSVIHFSKECSNIWVDFRGILFAYFHKTINEESFFILDNAIMGIINSDTGLKNVDFEVFRNNHSQLQNNKDDYRQATAIINSIEDEYIKLIKKVIKKKM